MGAEWSGLRPKGVWDEKGVREWRDVVAEAKAANTKANVGRLFDVTVEENSELLQILASLALPGKEEFLAAAATPHAKKLITFYNGGEAVVASLIEH